MVVGFLVLVGLLFVLKFDPPVNASSLNSSEEDNPSFHSSTKSTKIVRPALPYVYTENCTAIGMYGGNSHQNSCDRKAFSNIKMYDDENVFVNRKHEIKDLTKFHTRHRVHIVSVYGPPGFGKSRLAIRWGVEVVKNGTDLRYEDLKESILRTIQPLQSGSRDARERFSAMSLKHQNVEMAEFRPTTDNINVRPSRFSKQVDLMEELLHWSERIECPTVLVLDNADVIIYDEMRVDAHPRNFFEKIRKIVDGAHGRLDVIVTSQYKLSTHNTDTVNVKSLDLNSSIELITELIGDSVELDEVDAEQIVQCVGRCPLAIHIVAGILRNNDAEVTTLKKQLENHPMQALDDLEGTLYNVFNLSFTYLEKAKLHDCVYCASLFPGSFGVKAGEYILAVVPHIDNYTSTYCHEVLIKHSLLEKYFASTHERFEMHRLIREYSIRKHGHVRAKAFQAHFNDTFSKFYAPIMVDHARFIRDQDPTSDLWKVHDFEYSLENLNMEYLVHILISKDTRSAEELQALAFINSTRRVIPIPIETYYHEYVKSMNEVCGVLSETDCEDLYIEAVSYVLQNMCNSTITGHAMSLFSACHGLFDCKTLQTLHMYQRESAFMYSQNNIWIRLRPIGHAQIYLRHLEISYCKALPLFNLVHFPVSVILLLVSAELAVMDTVIQNPPIPVLIFFVFVVLLCIADVLSMGYEIMWRYPDEVVESCIASIAEIIIYLTSFVVFIPRIFMPYCRMYRNDNYLTQSRAGYSLVILLVYIVCHYVYTSFPNVLVWYDSYYGNYY